MRIFITLLMVVSILFSGLTSYAFGKKKVDKTVNSSEEVESVVSDSQETVNADVKKSKKAKKEKKNKKDKRVNEVLSSEPTPYIQADPNESVQTEPEKKVKSSKKSKREEKRQETMPILTDKQSRQIEYVENYYNAMTKNRSKLAMYMNPNLDIREVRASHILVKSRKDAIQIKKDIKNGVISFEEAARQYSLCPSAVNGGDLGFFDRKKMAQQFADTAFDLKIGEISDPVGTKFGWHIIKTTDKR